jgi:hypothetical protein
MEFSGRNLFKFPEAKIASSAHKYVTRINKETDVLYHTHSKRDIRAFCKRNYGSADTLNNQLNSWLFYTLIWSKYFLFEKFLMRLKNVLNSSCCLLRDPLYEELPFHLQRKCKYSHHPYTDLGAT